METAENKKTWSHENSWNESLWLFESNLLQPHSVIIENQDLKCVTIWSFFLFLPYRPLIRERDLKDVHEGKYLFSFITFFTLSVRFPFALTCINGKWLSSSMENYRDYCCWEVVCTLSPFLKTTEICTGTREECRLFKHDRLTPPWHALEK